METKHIIYKNFSNNKQIQNKKKLTNFLNFKNLLKKYPLLNSLTNNYKYYMGDLFLYGLLDFIKSCWKIDTWYPTNTGLESLGRNFLLALDIEPPKIWNVNAKLSGNSTWIDLLRTHTSYRDVENIKWIDLRGYWIKWLN